MSFLLHGATDAPAGRIGGSGWTALDPQAKPLNGSGKFPSQIARQNPTPLPLVRVEQNRVVQVGDELGWRSFLARLDVPAAIFSCTSTDGKGGRYSYAVGFDEFARSPGAVELMLDYAQHAWDDNPDGGSAIFRPSEIGDLAAMAEDSALAARLADKLRAFGHAAAMRHSRPPTQIEALFFRARKDGDFSASNLDRLADVLPIFMNSAAAQITAARIEQHAGLLEGMLERVAIAMFLLHPDGRPIYCNGAAREMIASKSLLALSHDGSIVCRVVSDTKTLRSAIAAAAAQAKSDRSEAVLRLQADDDSWRLGFILPAVASAAGGRVPCAMLLIQPRQSDDTSDALLQALGLLRSEQRFLSCFLTSRSLSEAAVKGGLSEETARTYLKRIRAKLGVHRQMELTRLIYGLALPLRRPVDTDNVAA